MQPKGSRPKDHTCIINWKMPLEISFSSLQVLTQRQVQCKKKRVKDSLQCILVNSTRSLAGNELYKHYFVTGVN